MKTVARSASDATIQCIPFLLFVSVTLILEDCWFGERSLKEKPVKTVPLLLSPLFSMKLKKNFIKFNFIFMNLS